MDTPPQAPVAPAPQPPAQPSTGPDNHTIMGVLAYLGILVIVPFLMSKNDPFVKFHIQQGLVLVIIEIVMWAVSGMFWDLWFFINLVQLATFVLSIVGIVNVVQHKQTELPLVGSFAKNIHI